MNWNEARQLLGNLSASMFHPEQAHALFDIVQTLSDDASILEIGPYHGYSTCALAAACVDTKRHIWTIDTFKGNPRNTDEQDGECYYEAFMQNVTARGLEAYITPLKGKSSDFYEWHHPWDLLFIDGNHALEIVTDDLAAFYPQLRAGGWLAMHDVYRPGKAPYNAPNTWTPLLETLSGLRYLYNMAWGVKRI